MIMPKYVHLKFAFAYLAYNPFNQSIPIKILLITIFILSALLHSCLGRWLCWVLPPLHCAVLARFVQAKCALDFSTPWFLTSETIFILINFSIRVCSPREREYFIFFVK
jgi:hypothetical protein